MITKEGFEYTKRTKYVYVYKQDGNFFTHYKLCRWYCILKWRQEIGYIHNVENIFLKERFPFRHKNKSYEFLPQFKIWYQKDGIPEYLVYTVFSEWYREAYRKSFLPKYNYMNIRFLDELEMKKNIKDMKTTLDFQQLIEVKLLKDVLNKRK